MANSRIVNSQLSTINYFPRTPKTPKTPKIACALTRIVVWKTEKQKTKNYEKHRFDFNARISRASI